MGEYFDWRFALPADDGVSPSLLKRLSPWAKQVAGLNEDGARRMLRDRWKNVPNWLEPLRNRILTAGAPHLIGKSRREWLGLTLGAQGRWAPPVETAEDPWTWTIYVAPPGNTTEATKALSKAGLEGHADARAFVENFDHLRESEPGFSGGFIPVSRWESFRRHGVFDLLDSGVREGWADARMIFHCRNGDDVLLHPSGEVAIFLLAEGRMTGAWKSFREFLVDYADHLGYRWPFDGYGPSEEAIVKRRERETS